MSEQHQKSFIVSKPNSISLKLSESFKDRKPPVTSKKGEESFLQIRQ